MEDEFRMVENIPSLRMAQPNVEENADAYPNPDGDQEFQSEMEEMLYAQHAEVKTFLDLQNQRGTPIPALFNQFYKYIQNPSSVSVETFKRMVDTDDTVGSAIDFLTTCLAARIGRYQHKNKEITKWVNARLDEIQGGWNNVLKEILSASWAGFAVAEKVWANTPNGFVPKKVVSLPPGTVLFETDRVGEITEDGILQYQRNYNPALFGTGSSYLFGFTGFAAGQGPGVGRPDAYAKLGDLPFPLRTANTYSYLSIRIPRLKCIHYSFDAQGKFGNPYGRSLLRRCYKWYVMKDAFIQMLAVALDRKGTPLTIVFADPNTTLENPAQTQGAGNVKGKKVGIRADVAAREAFKNIHNDTTIILPGKKGQVFDTDFVPSDANTEGFISAINLCDKGIMRATLLPSLIFTGGDGTGSYSLGQEHAKTFDKICDGIISGTKQAILEQLVMEMIAYNFPRDTWEKDGFGDFSKRELTQDEREKEMNALKQAYDMGAIDPAGDLEDLNKIRDMVGFSEKEELIPQAGGLFGEETDEDGNPIDPGDGSDAGDGEELPPDGDSSKGKPGVGKKPKPNPFDGNGGSKDKAGKE